LEVARLVKASLTQGQFDALVDFVFNLGSSRLASSTLLVDLNAGRYDAAGAELLRWDHTGYHEVSALKVRRQAEYRLWQSDSFARSGAQTGANSENAAA
jgi:lysozyme